MTVGWEGNVMGSQDGPQELILLPQRVDRTTTTSQHSANASVQIASVPLPAVADICAFDVFFGAPGTRRRPITFGLIVSGSERAEPNGQCPRPTLFCLQFVQASDVSCALDMG